MAHTGNLMASTVCRNGFEELIWPKKRAGFFFSWQSKKEVRSAQSVHAAAASDADTFDVLRAAASIAFSVDAAAHCWTWANKHSMREVPLPRCGK